MPRQYIDLRVGESVRIGDAMVTVLKKIGKTARFCVEAPEATLVRKLIAGVPASQAARGVYMEDTEHAGQSGAGVKHA